MWSPWFASHRWATLVPLSIFSSSQFLLKWKAFHKSQPRTTNFTWKYFSTWLQYRKFKSQQSESVKQTWQQVCITPLALRASIHDYTPFFSSSVLCLLSALKTQDKKYMIMTRYFSKGVVTFQKIMTILVSPKDIWEQILCISE